MLNEELKKEAREQYGNSFDTVYWGIIDSLIDRATLAERKRCAEIARTYENWLDYPLTCSCNEQISNVIEGKDKFATAIEKGEEV